MTSRLGSSFLRLFVVQASWNYDRMIGVGAGIAEEPLLRDLKDSDGDGAYRAAVGRGSAFFNSHPYLAGLAVGATARAEHDHVPPEQIERLRAALCGPLGSLGDRLVWAGWLPFVSGLAVAAAALGAGAAAVVGFLVLYNAGHVFLRWWALRAGWEHGMRVAAALHAPALQRAARLTAPAMAFAMGMALPAGGAALSGVEPAWARAVFIALTLVGLGVLGLRRGDLDGARLGLGVTLLALAVGGMLW
jgi:PTS system mannose-specific IID component